MKKIFSLALVAFASSLFTILGYNYLKKDSISNQKIQIEKRNTENNIRSNIYQVKHDENSLNAVPSPIPDFSKVVKTTKDAVVHVRNTRYYVQYQRYFYGYREGPVQKQEGTGSGVIISPDGYIVTNNHVIKDAAEIEVTLENKKTYKAKLVGTDIGSDVAVLKIDAENLPFLPFGDSDNVKLGEWALAIGNPFNLGTTVTAGIISAKARDIKGTNHIDSFIQTDAVVNPGNSGGALVNTHAQFIGMNTMIYSRTGSYIGYSFAIPSNIVKKIVDDILEYGMIQKGVLGIRGAELNDKVSKELRISETEGVYIYGIEADTGAEKAGLEIGDIIVKMDNTKISTMADLLGFLKTKNPNDLVDVVVLRNHKKMNFEVALNKSDSTYIKSLGITIKDINQKTLKKYGLKNGVIISNVNNNLLYQNGIRPGYIITEINNNRVYSINDVRDILSNSNLRQNTIQFVSPDGRTERYIFQ